VLFLSIVVPLLILYWARRLEWPATALFIGASAVSVLSGVAIHALGAVPAFVLGLEPLHGVKLQLCGALLLALPLLFSKNDAAALFHQDFGSLSLRLWALAGAAIFVLYWVRSGNHPLVPVTDGERHLRDALETFFTARPRFKEFLFGHPLFLMGLWLARRPLPGRWWGDGRVFVWLGLVGQISILNTFTHFQTPFSTCVVRTFHGIWLGLALAILSRRVLRLEQ
jgi:hypothetical protein